MSIDFLFFVVNKVFSFSLLVLLIGLFFQPSESVTRICGDLGAEDDSGGDLGEMRLLELPSRLTERCPRCCRCISRQWYLETAAAAAAEFLEAKMEAATAAAACTCCWWPSALGIT
jgi:hypothetical protein